MPRLGAGVRNLGWEGRQFGNLTVVRFDPESKIQTRWIVRCVCGREKSVFAFSLRSGGSKSCGIEPCVGRGTHYSTNTRLFNIWSKMRARCECATNPGYKNYGGRGIRVCKAWQKFENFRAWAESHGYAETLSIERKDVNGNYTPRNCMWIPILEQSANRRNCLFIGGRPAKALAEELGVTIQALHWRVKQGWTGKKLLRPSRFVKRQK